jgi:hypothetical protein
MASTLLPSFANGRDPHVLLLCHSAVLRDGRRPRRVGLSPLVGAAMVFTVWIWDRALVNGTLPFGSGAHGSDQMPNSVELLVIRSSLHQQKTPETPPTSGPQGEEHLEADPDPNL